jgi:hypothetical protein
LGVGLDVGLDVGVSLGARFEPSSIQVQ